MRKCPNRKKRRIVCSLPTSNLFGPLNNQDCKRRQIIMTIDEYEVIRLIDLENLTQEECAQQMHVARTTVQGIYMEARKKLAYALVQGRRLLIEGGDYHLCERQEKNCTCHGQCWRHQE